MGITRFIKSYMLMFLTNKRGFVSFHSHTYKPPKIHVKFSPPLVSFVTKDSKKTMGKNLISVMTRADMDTSIRTDPRLPYLFERVIAALIYVIPALDACAVTLSFFKWWSSLSWAWFIL